MYYTYMLRCEDNSIYTGITSNLERRICEHLNKTEKCAKYTKRHTVCKFECAWESNDRVTASKLEFHIKQLTKKEKEILIQKNNIKDLLKDKVNSVDYIRKDKMEKLSDLVNIGKEVENQLNKVKIYTKEDLKKLGSKTAWLRIQKIDKSACIHRLLALEGAIQGVKKNELNIQTKIELKEFYNKHKI